jgi:hypothetical protein
LVPQNYPTPNRAGNNTPNDLGIIISYESAI